MPIEIYIAILAACACIVLLTASFLIGAVYFKARVSSMEKQVTQLEGDLSGLIHESNGFVKTMQQVALRATGTMGDVEQMTHTARGWTDRADQAFEVVANVTEPRVAFVSKYIKYGNGFLTGVMQVLLPQGTKS